MAVLVLGLILFFAPHLLREFGLRQPLKDALPSEGAYMGLYSLVSLAGLALIIWGKSLSPFQMIWQPIYEWRSLSLMLMIPALICVVAGNVPLSYLRKLLRNPMLVGILLWSLSHLWSNGDLASMLLFGSFAIWSSVKIFTLRCVVNVESKSPEFIWDIISLLAGLGLYVVIGLYHGELFGVGISLA
ncbi:MAG: NnrU family protein [SAR86 cluster bacterium]|uniref:NnrU family protein n=1 Tax=SAR86 cluster bacterium TaxID=2030880 RepID=A0A2A4WT21_9GAMM|nr:MAG: NnrU family protein [SAR86 cluster bacterium]